MKDQPGFCYEIFKNIAFWNTSHGVNYNPCSFYHGFIAQQCNVDQAWRGAGRKKIIDIVASGQKVTSCHRCYDEESNGRVSRRQSSADLYENFLHDTDLTNTELGPTGLDYSVGNWCNLKCIVCGPDNSSSWISDYKKLYPKRDVSHFVARKSETIEIEDDSILTNIKIVHFHGGGEPLLNSAHVRLLERIHRVKGLNDVRVFYNTNATVRVNDLVLELWSKCKLIELYFSLDDVGLRFEYQRTGANWQSVCDNIQWYKQHMPHNHMFNINCVWGYLNLYYLDELYQWHLDNLATNRYGDPCNLVFQKAIGPFAISHLDPNVINLLRQRFLGKPALLQLLEGIHHSNNSHKNFWHYIEKIDAIRGRSFREICPDWSLCL